MFVGVDDGAITDSWARGFQFNLVSLSRPIHSHTCHDPRSFHACTAGNEFWRFPTRIIYAQTG